MNKGRWKLLQKCADFERVYNYIFDNYGKDYYSILDKIENELEFCENASDEEFYETFNFGNIPDSILWYYGAIDTDNFLTNI